ncbi:hypothetical protein FIBSPDRAFT_861302 [Athelia psychrophila]|uniref:Uncharacterized protein n=1 Tax=Athelia psychrophila TaxID=1759441 RepID=A0A166JH85_9AGAM|nr:hypothetical protein FIBSPDRAFT_861302 [Fibularhizoctonia sp. CBS 109695]
MATSSTSSSSYDFLSAPASSDDEVVYSPQESTDESSSDSGNESLISDDDDFVVLSRTRSPCLPRALSPSGESTFSTDDVLSSALSSLSMSQSSAAAFLRDAVHFRLGGVGRSTTTAPAPAPTTPKATKVVVKVKPELTEQQKKKLKREKRKAKLARRRAREAQQAQPPSTSNGRFPVVDDASSIASQQSSTVPGLTKAQRKKASKAMQGLQAATPTSSAPHFPIVDDASSVASADSAASTVSTATVTGYEDASNFITGFLSSPEGKDAVNKLALLQALILELGVADAAALPTTITSAKKLLKAEAHVNIREYMAVREGGQDALKGIMHASRGSLVKSIRKKKNPASLTWVKQQGLSVLLVQCFC